MCFSGTVFSKNDWEGWFHMFIRISGKNDIARKFLCKKMILHENIYGK